MSRMIFMKIGKMGRVEPPRPRAPLSLRCACAAAHDYGSGLWLPGPRLGALRRSGPGGRSEPEDRGEQVMAEEAGDSSFGTQPESSLRRSCISACCMRSMSSSSAPVLSTTSRL